MNSLEIYNAQKKSKEVFNTQELINSGEVWKLGKEEISKAFKFLKEGKCMFGKEAQTLDCGVTLPSRKPKHGVMGSIANAVSFYSKED